MFANGWFTACDGFYGASAYWLSHMKQYTIIGAGMTRPSVGATHLGSVYCAS